MRDILQNLATEVQNHKVNKNKVSLRNYHRLEETKEISWLSSTWSSRLYPGTEMGHQRKDLGILNAVC